MENVNIIPGGEIVQKPEKTFIPLREISAIELDQMHIPPIEWIVPGLLPVGVCVFAAPPKYYKSYLALGLCLAVCQGLPYLGFQTVKGGCLYYDLESSKRRPKARIDQILGRNTMRPDNMYIVTGSEPVAMIGEGFEEQLKDQLNKHPEIKLIVVDVFALVRKPQKANQSIYEKDTADIKPLTKIATEKNVAIMLITHTTKMKHKTDIYNEISGSMAVLGKSDCSWMISKEQRNDESATLHVIGRDLESIDLEMMFNQDRMRWERIGTAEEIAERRFRKEYEESPVIMTIKAALKESGGQWRGTAGELRTFGIMHNIPVSEDVRQMGTTIRAFGQLLVEDHILYDTERTSKGRYFLFRYVD